MFGCECQQSRGVKQENSADEPCFNVFTCFDGIIQLFQAQEGSESSESQDEFEEKPYNDKNKLFDSQKSSNPSWRS